MGQTQIVGSILGTAVGDAIGLPYEGLSRHRATKILGAPDRHRLIFGYGMVSDDTEHTCLVAQSLIASAGHPVEFQRQLAWRLRVWLLSLPAGVGLATLKAILRLWCGFSPRKSGIFSAGNGPAMRAAILGVAIADRDRLRELVRISTRITHTDPKAEYGALAIAIAAQFASQTDRALGDRFLLQLQSFFGEEASELIALVRSAIDSVKRRESTSQFAETLGLDRGISGYIYDCVPVAIHAWLSYPQDFRLAITTVVECGGDTDSTAAIVGGIVGAAVGKDGIPREWLYRLVEPARSIQWMERLGIQLHSSVSGKGCDRAIEASFLGILFRNLFFLGVVLLHGFRRLLPPY